VLGIALAVIAQCGDLSESFLKRAVNIKDSGNILPGHGGILDRLDGVMFAAPVLYYYAVLLLVA
jgi:phosphatidate cytidylyltransferase